MSLFWRYPVRSPSGRLRTRMYKHKSKSLLAYCRPPVSGTPIHVQTGVRVPLRAVEDAVGLDNGRSTSIPKISLVTLMPRRPVCRIGSERHRPLQPLRRFALSLYRFLGSNTTCITPLLIVGLLCSRQQALSASTVRPFGGMHFATDDKCRRRPPDACVSLTYTVGASSRL